MEVMVTDVHLVDCKAPSLMPGTSDGQVTDPRIAVQGALFLLTVERVDVTPARVVICLRLDALVGQIVEVGRELGLEHVLALHVHGLTVEQIEEILPADVEDVVSAKLANVLVHLHAARAEQLGNVVVAEEGRGDFEAASPAESPLDVTVPEDGVSEHAVLIAEHLQGNLTHGQHLPRADPRSIHLDALA